MQKSIFEVLGNDYGELKSLGIDIEKNIYLNPSDAIMKSRLFAEKLLIRVAEIEGEDYLKSVKQFERINLLNKEGILDDPIVKEFHFIRVTGNKVAHAGENNDIEYSVKIHKKLYIIIKWFLETYGDYKFLMPPYRPVELPKSIEAMNTSLIDELIQKKLEKYIDETNKKSLFEEKGIERDLSKSKEEIEIEEAAMKILGFQYKDEILTDEPDEVQNEIRIEETTEGIEEESSISYTFSKYKGSYLLNELRKLSDASKEAVESSRELEPFKKYLHIKRSIQEELIEVLKKCKESNKAQLVLLCGNVGDGKSHLLAYLNEEYKDLLQGFQIHNDATESFDPERTEIETLEEVLRPFEDDYIESSNHKLILAINLGVLNKFLEVNIKKNKYTAFYDYVMKSGLFEQDTIYSGIESESDNFKLVSFGDYNIYELTSIGPYSSYIKSLFNKIVEKDEGNPFYKAYLMDIESEINNPILINYKLLTIPNVMDAIVKQIVYSIVKSKKVISTRELMNFIYEVIVPPNFEEFDMSSTSSDYNEALVPNLIYNSKERGILLRILSDVDPLRVRDEKIDNLIIKLNIATEIKNVLHEYFDEDTEFFIDYIIGANNSIANVPEGIKQQIIDTIIRFLSLAGKKEYSKAFEDKEYIKFMEYLYYYNIGQPRGYKDLFDEVKQAVYNWNGSPEADYLFINEKLENFMIAEKVEFKRSTKVGKRPEREQNKLEHFTTNITLGYEGGIEKHIEAIVVDYQLYKKIVDVNRGYFASKNDKEEAVIFVEFIDRLIALGNMKSELLIKDIATKKSFKLLYEDDFDEEFIFERLD